MSTRKTQLRLLSILICAIAVLWLVEACGEDAVEDVSANDATPANPTASKFTPTPVKESPTATAEPSDEGESSATAEEPPTPEEEAATATAEPIDERQRPSVEEKATTAAAERTGEDVMCEANMSALAWVSEEVPIDEELQDEDTPYDEWPQVGRAFLASWMLLVYDALFRRQPNFVEVSTGFLRDGEGGWTETWGINVWVTEKVDQGTLPPEYRIPDYLERVPVTILEEEPIPMLKPAMNVCECALGTVFMDARLAFAENLHEDDAAFRRAKEVIRTFEYNSLFFGQPNAHGVSPGQIRGPNGRPTGTIGIIVSVTEKVDRNMLPRWQRIPNYVEGVPVQVIEEEDPGVHIQEVSTKYEPLFARQPNVQGFGGVGILRDGYGGRTEAFGINIDVIKKVDQRALPPGHRIPGCLEGVPIQIVETPVPS